MTSKIAFAVILSAVLLATAPAHADDPTSSAGAFVDSFGWSCGYESTSAGGVLTWFMWCDDGSQYSGSRKL